MTLLSPIVADCAPCPTAVLAVRALFEGFANPGTSHARERVTPTGEGIKFVLA